MKAITLRRRKMLKAPEIIEREKKNAVDGVVEETEFPTETPREEEKGVEKPHVEIQVKHVHPSKYPYKPPISYPQ